jgi:hypothetical protein
MAKRHFVPRELIALAFLCCIAALALLCSPPAQAAGDEDFEALEKEIVKEVNLARRNPGV